MYNNRTLYINCGGDYVTETTTKNQKTNPKPFRTELRPDMNAAGHAQWRWFDADAYSIYK